MKKKRTVMTTFLIVITVFLLGATIYISTLLTSSTPPTQIQKTKAAPISYSRKVDLFPTGGAEASNSPISATPTTNPTVVPTAVPTLLALAPTRVPTVIPTKVPLVPTDVPTGTPVPTIPLATPTLQPLLAYKSTSISPTIVPGANKGGTVISPTITSSVTRAAQPTGVQQLPETGWIQTSSILFIVATSTILFSLLF